jgi:hypothetical protein
MGYPDNQSRIRQRRKPRGIQGDYTCVEDFGMRCYLERSDSNRIGMSIAHFVRVSPFVVLETPFALAQSENVGNTPPASPALSTVHPSNLLTSTEIALAIVVLVFGLGVILISLRLFKENIKDKPELVSQTIIVILIIVGTLFLISAGLSNDQIAPAIGLFGTIAGYLLGRAERRSADQSQSPTSEGK